MGSAEGRFDFTLALYQSDSFTSAYARGAAISVGTTIYAKIDFKSGSDLYMFVQDCYATPVDNHQSTALQYMLIKPGGYVSDTVLITVFYPY